MKTQITSFQNAEEEAIHFDWREPKDYKKTKLFHWTLMRTGMVGRNNLLTVPPIFLFFVGHAHHCSGLTPGSVPRDYFWWIWGTILGAGEQHCIGHMQVSINLASNILL